MVNLPSVVLLFWFNMLEIFFLLIFLSIYSYSFIRILAKKYYCRYFYSTFDTMINLYVAMFL
ncbi:hypothetical protein DN643_02915 [Escherichia coli]|nr:hypothetical protein BWI82_03670 [Escherichia coli]HAJ6410295.1 hypothetical protein [Escherichia coli HVH 93 (4-5851025)]HBX2619832.1 hypothetical protein [Klebsiella pneumoniae]EEY5779446.1 hypothetical protein [Escherichia coli]EFE7550410.1 hypothetical protein [Escherichia coli]